MKTLFRHIFRRPAPVSQALPRRRSRPAPTFEALDRRDLLTVTTRLSGDTLRIFGDQGDNFVSVSAPTTTSLTVTVGTRDVRSFSSKGLKGISFYGFDGNDSFYNNTSLSAYVNGGEGNDLLGSGGDNDTLIGGSGEDTYFFEVNRDLGSDEIRESTTNESDTFRFSGYRPVNVNLGSANLSGRVDGKVSDGLTLQLKWGAVENVYGGQADDIIVGSGGNNVLAGGWGRDDIFGMGGDDSLYGEEGNDVLHGGDGADTLWGQAGNDWLNGDAGDDILHGGDGNDTMGATLSFPPKREELGADFQRWVYTINVLDDPGNDWMAGDAGNDVIRGGTGNDTLLGGTGDDILGAAVVMTSQEWITSGLGENLSRRYVYQAFAEDGNDLIYGDAGNDVLRGGQGNDRLDGGNGNDEVGATQLVRRIVVGGIESKSDFGEDGNDQLSGGSGDDTVNGGKGSDWIYGNSGNDRLYAGWVNGSFDHDLDHVFKGSGTFDVMLDLDIKDAFWYATEGEGRHF